MKRTFIKVGLSVLMASVLLTGCGSRQNSFLETSTKVKIPSGLTNQEVEEIMKQLISSPKKENYQQYSINSRVVTAKYTYEFAPTPEGNLLVKYSEDCGDYPCSRIQYFPEIAEFKRKFENNKSILEKNLTPYLNEYALNKNEILNWIDKVNKLNLEINFEIKIPFNEEYLAEFKKPVKYKLKELTPEFVFKEFKNSKNPSLTSFLNTYPFCTYTNTYLVGFVDYKNVTMSFPSNLNLNNYKEIFATKKPHFKARFFPDKFVIQNKDIKLELEYSMLINATYRFKITNLTGNYIDISAVSLYVDLDIINTPFNVKLPPNAVIDGTKSIHIPSSVPITIPIESSDQTRNFGAAVSYKVNNVEKTLYDGKKFSYQ
ncbi:hypothetical protein PT447_00115 [Aliarcobacter butzleri]|uniref:hypothetical protein n=1 Tax=Aliarcobacter butzleri TaxID=28197 RepID=UPI0024DE6AF8|nr:hypothetical protein [Aliarcobacter butzleri]MDK2063323.1 hypothetical protein [Aliarcobacter butzleri]